jgi:hypothetical protein
LTSYLSRAYLWLGADYYGYYKARVIPADTLTAWSSEVMAFGAWDYAVFAVTLVISTAIGVFVALQGNFLDFSDFSVSF